MQCTSYLSGYYYTREQNVDASGSLWQQFNNGFFCRSGRDYNILSQQPMTDQYLAYNKEILRQTMLKHESLFMYQVHELHRLYGRQRELMDEIKMMELSKDHLRMQTFVSGMLCDTSKKALQLPGWLLSNPRDDKPSVHGVENFQRPSNFVSKKSIHAGSDVYLEENHLKELEVSSCGRNKYGKRMLNLELPPEEYMDSDGGEELEKEKSSEVSPVQLDPSVRFVDSSPKSNLILRKGASSDFNSSCSNTSCLLDLNAPLPSDEPVTISSSLVDSNMSSTGIKQQDPDLSGKPRSKTPDLMSIASDVLEGKASIEANSGLPVQSAGKLTLPCNDKTILGSKSTKKEQDFNINELRMLSSCVTTASQLVQFSDQTNTGASASNSSWKTSYTEVPIAIQALPCFSSIQFSSKTSRSSSGSSVIKEKYSNGNAVLSSNLGCITSHMSCTSNNQPTAEYLAGFVEDPVHQIPVDMDLNTMPCNSVPEIEDSQDKDRSMVGEKKCENSVGPLNGPRVKPDSEDQIGGCPHLLDPPISRSQFCAFTAIDSNSNLSEENDIQNGEMVDLPASHMSCDSSHDSEKSPKDDETCPANDCGKEMSQLKTCMDLRFSNTDQKHSQVLTETTAVGTDLQAPISPDNKEHSPPREESEDNQSENHEGTVKELDRIAAEVILSIMFPGKKQSLNTSMSQLLEVSVDCLGWFAGIACTVAGSAENESEDHLADAPVGNCSDLAPKVLEKLEAMTFKSTGIKVEDHCHMTIDQKNKLIGDPLLTSEGQSRKARGWKDFQSQDLPCDSSLCSHDATENLRPIKKLRAAARTAHENVKVRKKVGRVGCAKGRRHSKRFPLNAISRKACSLSKQNPCQSEQSFLQSCSFGWGRKHRRQKHRRARSYFDLGFT
ncbi:uncharacterized protein [Coffea arabica]|uniref:Uncharacterized protein n=1 Tax=Coffea arabica TaxID=13443 RepID=A0A6P6XEJ0_COFAR|nr:uncharacterized protein LOC113741170 [Coffea arabica]